MNFFRSKPKTPSTYNPLSANAIQIMNKYTIDMNTAVLYDTCLYIFNNHSNIQYLNK